MDLDQPADRHRPSESGRHDVPTNADRVGPASIPYLHHVDVPPPVEVTIRDGAAERPARLAVPGRALAVAVFVHGGGAGGRTSIRDGFVAERMQRHGVATVLVDLLTRDESAASSPETEVVLLAGRVGSVVDFVRGHPSTAGRPVALVGSGAGSPAALRAVASSVRGAVAVVCCGGPVELVGDAVVVVDVPVLVLVAGSDALAAERATRTIERLQSEHRLDAVPGEHLDDLASLDQVATSATAWIVGHLPAG